MAWVKGPWLAQDPQPGSSSSQKLLMKPSDPGGLNVLDKDLGLRDQVSSWKCTLTPEVSQARVSQPCTSKTGSSPAVGPSRGKWESEWGEPEKEREKKRRETQRKAKRE